MSNLNPDVSIVIPVYRSARLLPPLVSELKKLIESRPESFEVLLVNDGSPDESWDVIRSLIPLNDFIVGINLMRNYGQHNALLAGIRKARGAIIVTLDDDLQTPPSEVPKLLKRLEEGFDLVYGVRSKEQHGLVRNFCSLSVKWLLDRGLGVKFASSISSYKAFRSELRRAFENHTGSCVFIDALLFWGTTKIGSVRVEHKDRLDGRSGYNLRRLLLHTMNMVTSFSHLPLQIASIVGLLATLAGLGGFLYVLGAFIMFGKTVPGFTFLAAALTLFSGLQMFVLGIIGEYLARMHQKLLGVPSYTIREMTKEDSL